MRFAVQTVLWGHSPVDYRRMFAVIKDAGFSGVELFQHPQYLGHPKKQGDIGNAPEILGYLKDAGLELIGMCSGGLDLRIDWLEEGAKEHPWFDPKSPYLYLDAWGSEVAERRLREGWRIAFHPYYLLEHGTADQAFRLLESQERLLYLPDTAHATIQREDPLKGIRQYANRLAGVHLKDWRPGFGRVSSLYARGFTELGNGVVPLKEVLAELRDPRYGNAWVVYEQDCTEGFIEQSLQDSACWLREELVRQGVGDQFNPTFKSLPAPQRIPPNVIDIKQQRVGLSAIDTPGIPKFVTAKLAGASVGQIYLRAAQELRESLNLPGVAIWCCSEMDNVLVLAGLSVKNEAAVESDPALPLVSWRIERRLSPVTLRERKKLEEIPQPVRKYLAEGTNEGCRVFRLPISSEWNPHQTRLVVDLALRVGSDPTLDERTLLAESVIRAIDWHLDCLMASIGAELNYTASQPGSLDDFGRALREIVKKRLNCDHVALFLTDLEEVHLKPFVSNDLTWVRAAPQSYLRVEGQITSEAWRLRRPYFSGRKPESRPAPKSWWGATPPDPSSPLMTMPIVDTQGNVVGVVRCAAGRSTQRHIAQFTDDDLIILDSTMQQALPTLRLRQLVESEQQRNLLMAHELKRPVGAICTAADLLQAGLMDEPKTRAYLDPFVARQIRSVVHFSETLRTLVFRSSFFGGRGREFQVVRRRTRLMAEVIAPTVKLLREDLEREGFDPNAIWYDGYYDLPAVWVDLDMFQQIVFNLLDNALKYVDKNKSKFSVEIIASLDKEEEPQWFTIQVKDHGIGIPPDARDRIFDMGRRGPNAHEHAPGSGIGLWLVRELLRLHGGAISLEDDPTATVFRIDLPSKLAKKDWQL